MDVVTAIRDRRAVRDYLSHPIGEATIDELLEAACWAPSAMNRQPWAFLVVRDRSTLDRVAEKAKHFLLADMPAGSPLARYRGMLEDPGFHVLYHAPALVVVWATLADEIPGLAAAEDCCLAAQNLMLAAHAAGLGTCWIGFARPWLAEPAAKRSLGIPDSWSPVAPIVVGRPRSHPCRSERVDPPILWQPPR